MNSLIRRGTFPGFEDFPSSGLRIFEDTVNRLFTDAASTRPWSPSVDITENENELILMADVPGIKMEDIDLKVEDGTLSFSGKREFEKEETVGGYHRMERGYGTFHRAFTLPDSVDVEHVSAKYTDGVLTVKLPKKELAKPRSIKVAVGKN